jgi:hypothetical protein
LFVDRAHSCSPRLASLRRDSAVFDLGVHALPVPNPNDRQRAPSGSAPIGLADYRAIGLPRNSEGNTVRRLDVQFVAAVGAQPTRLDSEIEFTPPLVRSCDRIGASGS